MTKQWRRLTSASGLQSRHHRPESHVEQATAPRRHDDLRCCAHLVRPLPLHCQRAPTLPAPIAQPPHRPESPPCPSSAMRASRGAGCRGAGRPLRRRCERRLGSLGLPLPSGYQTANGRVPTWQGAEMAIRRPSMGYVQNSTPILQGRCCPPRDHPLRAPLRQSCIGSVYRMLQRA